LPCANVVGIGKFWICGGDAASRLSAMEMGFGNARKCIAGLDAVLRIRSWEQFRTRQADFFSHANVVAVTQIRIRGYKVTPSLATAKVLLGKFPQRVSRLGDHDDRRRNIAWVNCISNRRVGSNTDRTCFRVDGDTWMDERGGDGGRAGTC